MIMPLSMGDTVFPLASDELCLDIAAALGFDGVDLFAIPEMSRLNPTTILADPVGTAAAVRSRYGTRGLAISDFFPHPGGGFANPLSPNTPDAGKRRESREWFERMLEFAIAIGAPGMTLMPGVRWESETPGSSLARAAEELAWRAEKGANAGVVVSVEPHIDSVVDTPQLTLALLDQASGLTLTIDYSHFVHDGLTDDDCEPLLPHTRHVHCRAAARGRLQESLRRNTIDFPRMVRGLADAGYHGYLCCENIWFEPLGADDVDNMSETIMLRDTLLAALEEVESRAAGRAASP